LAHLIDITLVTLAISGAVFAVVRYFIDLVRPATGPPASCSGCQTACHAGDANNLKLITVEKLKSI